MIHNPNCDGSHCFVEQSDVRILPVSKREGACSNAILCFACYRHEMRWRTERNRELAPDAQFDLPKWNELEIYEGAK